MKILKNHCLYSLFLLVVSVSGCFDFPLLSIQVLASTTKSRIHFTLIKNISYHHEIFVYYQCIIQDCIKWLVSYVCSTVFSIID